MISYVKGIVESIEDDKVIVDNNGIGYGIFMPQESIDTIGEGEEVKIYTFYSVREDAIQLYGFLTRSELKMFKLLKAVSGVGPKCALSILSTCPGDALSIAIVSDDAKAISKAPGVGAKTAQRIIIELKDKIDIEEVIRGGIEDDMPKYSPTINSGVMSDAVDALVALGYSQSLAFNAVRKVENSADMDVEQLLKAALKHMI